MKIHDKVDDVILIICTCFIVFVVAHLLSGCVYTCKQDQLDAVTATVIDIQNNRTFNTILNEEPQ